MYSPSPLYFVCIGLHALWCAFLGNFVAFIVILFEVSHRTPNNPPRYDDGAIYFLGSMTGAVVSLSFAAVRLWRFWLVNNELRELQR